MDPTLFPYKPAQALRFIIYSTAITIDGHYCIAIIIVMNILEALS